MAYFECTIRFDAVGIAPHMERFRGHILTSKEVETIQMISGGFYFRLDGTRSPKAILEDIEEDGYEYDDFDSIEFKKIG